MMLLSAVMVSVLLVRGSRVDTYAPPRLLDQHVKEHRVARAVLEVSATVRDYVIWFPHVCCMLTNSEEQLFTQLTWDYLDIVDQSSSYSSFFVILAQNMESMDKLPLTKTILIMPSGESVLEEFLAKTVGLAIHVRTDTESLTASLFVPSLSKHWEAYVNYLALGGLRQFDSSYAKNSSESGMNSTGIYPTQSPENDHNNSAWIVVALTVGLSTFFTVMLVRRNGRFRGLPTQIHIPNLHQ